MRQAVPPVEFGGKNLRGKGGGVWVHGCMVYGPTLFAPIDIDAMQFIGLHLRFFRPDRGFVCTRDMCVCVCVCVREECVCVCVCVCVCLCVCMYVHCI